MASITRRGPGQFRARIRRAGHPELTATFPTRELAESWAATIERTMREGRFAGLDAAQRITLGEAQTHALASLTG